MDQYIRSIEWYVYRKAPGHTAFKKYRLIGLFKKTIKYKWVGKKDTFPPFLRKNPIKLLNAFIYEAADFVQLWCRIGCFSILISLLSGCRGPPIQEFYSKILESRRKCHVAEK